MLCSSHIITDLSWKFVFDKVKGRDASYVSILLNLILIYKDHIYGVWWLRAITGCFQTLLSKAILTWCLRTLLIWSPFSSIRVTRWSNSRSRSSRSCSVRVSCNCLLSSACSLQSSINSLAPGRCSLNLNPLHATFFRRNKNIHLHFMSLLHIDMTQVVGILPQVRLWLTYYT